MIYYNFDGIRLPKPVELNGYDYQLICSNKDELFFTHSLMISKAPFEVLNDKICFDSAVDYQFYTARNNSTSWSEGSLTIIENDKATTTLASVIDSSDFLWTNEDIYRYESDEIVYKKFKAEEDIVALKPEIKTNLSQDKYYYQDDENIETLEIIAESPDGGELSYQWYKNGEKIEGAIFNTYKPIITEIGKNTYYCEITNNYQGDLASINSKTIIITVAEALVPINEEFLLGWKIGRLVAMLRGQQEPIIPDTPIVSLCLYGTPSTTGNIGLRVGESVTYYDGAVLPPLPETDMPYATIGKHLYYPDDYRLIFSTKPFKKAGGVSSVIDTSVSVLVSDYNADTGEWGALNPYTVNTYTFQGAFWSNYDELNADGSVYRAKSDPIPVSGLVGYKCGDWEVPAWDIKKYPYAGTYCYDYEEYRCFWFFAHTEQHYWTKENNFISDSHLYGSDDGVPDGVTWIKRGVNAEWEKLDKPWNIGTKKKDGEQRQATMWTNFDLYYSDGTLWSAASDPIPVYE